MPFIPFMALAGGVGYAAFRASKSKATREVAERAKTVAEAAVKAGGGAPGAPGAPANGGEPPISESLKIDDLKLELGYGLLGLVKEDETGVDRLNRADQGPPAASWRSNSASSCPRCAFSTTCSSSPTTIRCASRKSNPPTARSTPTSSWSWTLTATRFDLPGHQTTEPTFGLPATWIDPALRDEAENSAALSIIDPQP